MIEYVLDAACLADPEDAHFYLQDELNLPPYYSRNLDALYDCLTDMTDTAIYFENTDAAGAYFELVYAVMREAAEENTGLYVQDVEA